MAWSTSNRRQALPPDWARIRRRVLLRDKWCQVCGKNRSTQVDHDRRGNNHEESNLRGICEPCHKVKSANEGAAASAAVRKRIHAARKRPPEKHPGGWL